VDDLAIASSNDELRDELYMNLQKYYELTIDTSLEKHLGIKIGYEGDNVLLSQPKQLKQLFEHVKDIVINSKSPMSTSYKPKDISVDNKAVDYKVYKSILGGLIYMLKTRFDIAFAVGNLASRSHVANENDLNAIKRLITYLRGTQDSRLVFKRDVKENKKSVPLNAWTDAAFDVYPNESKSQFGISFALGANSGALYAKSGKGIVWFRELLKEIDLEQIISY
jgi:hypothetical protein